MSRHGHSRDRLISAALELMRERGYEAVGVEAICRKAGLNKGSFYHYFPGKTDLALAVVESCWQDYQKSILAPVFQPSTPPLERLSLFFDQCYRCHREATDRQGRVCGCFFGTLGGELSAREEKIRNRVENILQRITACFEEALEEAQGQGAIRLADVAATAQAMTACMEGMILLAKIYNNSEILCQLTPTIFQMIGASPPHPPEPAPASIAASVAGRMDFLD